MPVEPVNITQALIISAIKDRQAGIKSCVYIVDPKQLVPTLEALKELLIGYQELKNHFDTLIDKCTRAMPY